MATSGPMITISDLLFRTAAAADSGALVVFTVNYPLAYIAERVGGELVDVRFPAPADGDPAYWSPDPETIVALEATGVRSVVFARCGNRPGDGDLLSVMHGNAAAIEAIGGS